MRLLIRSVFVLSQKVCGSIAGYNKDPGFANGQTTPTSARTRLQGISGIPASLRAFANIHPSTIGDFLQTLR